MPNLTEFLTFDKPTLTEGPLPFPRSPDVVLPRNQWYYQYERKTSSADNRERQTSSNEHDRARELTAASDVISWMSLIAILSAIDIVWFMHRMARTYKTVKLVLYGSSALTGK